jgi:diguanylate cyclase (GGDEF)-like protein
LDLLVIVLGLMALALTVPKWLATGHPLGLSLLAIPVIVAFSAFPLVLFRPGGDLQIGFDAAVLIALGVALAPPQALVIWCAAGILSQVIAPKRLRARLFTVGLVTLVGFLALTTMSAIGGLGRSGGRELLAVLGGAAVYFAAGWFFTGLSLALESGVPLRRLLAGRDLPVSMVWFLGIACLGYLAVLLPRHEPWWIDSLLTVPTLAMLVAARAVRRAGEHQVRLSALLDAAKTAQLAESPRALLNGLAGHAARLLRSGPARIGDAPPGPEELGVRIGGDQGKWLVCPPRSVQAYDQADRRALAALAGLAEESLVRLRLATEMTALATSDPLTGLANRTVFRQRVAAALALRRPGRHIAVLFCDLDDFKQMNDRFGHEGGDAVLLAMATRLSQCVREGDTVARLGGDEFALLLLDLDSPAEAEGVAKRVIAAAAEPLFVARRPVVLGVSVGMAVDSATSAALTAGGARTLLGNADLAMYQAKAHGKRGYRVFQPSMRTERLARIELLEQLRGATGRDEFLLHYQPLVDLRSGAIEGFEALLRWQHPTLGLLAPPAFLALAEEAGLLSEISDWLLPKAYADACVLSACAGRALRIGVNVSVRQLRDDRILDLARDLPRAAWTPQLVLEVTESVFVDHEPHAVGSLKRLREAGVLLVLDDFGVGYSSVAYLRTLPFSGCKLDQSLTRALGKDVHGDALCRAVLAMCDSLGLPAVAEGVEDVRQATRLRDAGCRYGQGFALGRPGDLWHARAQLRESPVRLAETELVGG